MNEKKLILLLLMSSFLITLNSVIPKLDIRSFRAHYFSEDLGLASSPIVITNWSKTCEIYNWCSFENGIYKVNNLNLDTINNNTGLIIANTTDPFIIKNCSLISNSHEKEDMGIEIVNVSNGKLMNNTFTYIRYSIFIRNSFNITIIGNKINSSNCCCTPHGIKLVNCTNSSIQENYLTITHYGITIDNCSNILIIENMLEHNSWGVVSYSIRDCIIFNNTIVKLTHIGIAFIENCCSNLISENYLDENYHGHDGISLWEKSSYNVIIKNRIIGMCRYGIDLRECLNNSILNNIIIRNVRGIRLSKSNCNLVADNYIKSSSECILETECEFNIISNNLCEILPKFIPGYEIWIINLLLFIFVVIVIKKVYKKASTKRFSV